MEEKSFWKHMIDKGYPLNQKQQNFVGFLLFVSKAF